MREISHFTSTRFQTQKQLVTAAQKDAHTPFSQESLTFKERKQTSRLHAKTPGHHYSRPPRRAFQPAKSLFIESAFFREAAAIRAV